MVWFVFVGEERGEGRLLRGKLAIKLLFLKWVGMNAFKMYRVKRQKAGT